jgi:ABC-type bacteriocin/lantibiotic exporter with double-glycine peptidase domain
MPMSPSVLWPKGEEVAIFAQKRNRSSSWLPDELRWLAEQIRPLLHWHVASFLSITAGSVLALLTPLVLKWLIDRVIPEGSLKLLLAAVGLILLGSLGKSALTSLGNFLMLGSAQKLSLRLRVDLLKHLDSLSAEYYENTPVGRMMYPLKEPIEEVAYFGSDLLPAALRLVLTTAFTLGTMFWLSPLLTMAVLPLIPAFLVMRQYFRKQLVARADALQGKNLAWSCFLEEHLSSLVPIQLLGQEKRQERKAFRFLAHTVRSQSELFKIGTWFTLSNSLVITLAVGAVIGYGGVRVLGGGLSIGGLVAFYGFVSQLFEPLSGTAELYARCQKTFASVRQVQCAFALQTKVANAPDAVPLVSNHKTAIEFRDVMFSYLRQKYTLHVPALRIREGEHLGIAGDNGAGKSTLGKLMVRLYDPVQGSVRCGNQDIRNVRLDSLRKHIGYLAREPAFFEGTIASNLCLVKPGVTEQDLNDAIQMVGLSGFVSSLPQGLHQRIGPSGCQLSGGQRQRLALARMILQRPRILILDEATCGLDAEGEALVLKNLRRWLDSSTIIVVSHRLSTFSHLERILTLRAGRIVGDERPVIAPGSQNIFYPCTPADAVP